MARQESISKLRIGERLLEERTRLGLTQLDLAARYGATPSALSNAERGEREPSTACLHSLLAAGGDPLFVLFGVRVSEIASDLTPIELLDWRSLSQVVRWSIDGALRGMDQNTLSDPETLKKLYEIARTVYHNKNAPLAQHPASAPAG